MKKRFVPLLLSLFLVTSALSSCQTQAEPSASSLPAPSSDAVSTSSESSGESIPPQSAESTLPAVDYPYTLSGGESKLLSAQSAVNLAGEYALRLCGMDLSKTPAALTYDPECDSIYFRESPTPAYEGSVCTDTEYLMFKIDVQTGLLYSIDHGPYSESAGYGSAEGLDTTQERQEALQKLTEFLEWQGKDFTVEHMQWGTFSVTFQGGGGLYARYDKYPQGIALSQLDIVPDDDKPYPAIKAGLAFSDFHRLRGVNGLDEKGEWALTPREAWAKAASAAKAICGVDFGAMDCAVFGDGRNSELPQYYGTCVFSDGVTSVPEHLVYATDAVNSGYYEATWSVNALTGKFIHLSVEQAHTGFPTEPFADVAAQRAREVLDALGITGDFEVLETGYATVTVSDPEAEGHKYELLFSDTEGYPFRSLYYR